MADDLKKLLSVSPGAVKLGDYATDSHPGFDGDKKAAAKELEQMGPVLADLQERMFAGAYTETSNHRVLVVLQGMDTAGKGGIVNHSMGLLNPNAIHLKSFKKPTKEELAHDFLWRIDKELPAPGIVGVFDRSHYEDVLVGRVRELADAAEIERRYDAINSWEERLVDSGCQIVKCMLHISAETQKERLLARLDDPNKQWKFKPGDIDERAFWDRYQEAYEIALGRCSTAAAPWYVIPSDKKWYRNWAVAKLLLETFESLDLKWPGPDYDVSEQRRRLEEENR
jgi:PPK2 family polyphosphate:nucleotide phosphotransferase